MKRHRGQKSAAVGHRSQQNGGRFLCFKPIGVEIDRVTDKALFYEDKEIKIDASSGEKESILKGFARAVKSVLFRRKSRVINSEKIEGDGSCSFRFRKRNHDSDSEIRLTKSPSVRSTSSSTSSSSSCLSSQPSESTTSSNHNAKPPKQGSLKEQSSFKKQNRVEERSTCVKQQRFGWSPIVIGVVLIVITLTLTIVWGRLWAIGLNAAWLCSIPKQGRRRRRLPRLNLTKRRGSESEEERMITEGSATSVEQKRRVIMEGLLDRRHHHHQNCQQLMS